MSPGTSLLGRGGVTFAYVMPIGRRPERGFLYLSFDFDKRGPFEPRTQVPVFVVGINIEHLCYFITGTNFTQTFTVNIGIGRVPIKINLQGKIVKGIERHVNARNFGLAMRGGPLTSTSSTERISKVLTLAITK